MKRWLPLILLTTMLLVQCNGQGAQLTADEPDVDAGSDIETVTKDVAVIGADGDVAVDAGFASDGTVVPIPAGFTASQCRFTAAVATVDGNAISVFAGINDQTGEVVCEKVVQEREEVPPEVQGCVASFTVICTK